MTRAADILDALLARSPRTLPRDRRTGLPYGWAHWLVSLPPLPRPFSGSDVTAILAQRALPAAAARSPGLNAWQAFRRLWWQDWDPAPHDQRWWRRTAALCSLLLHAVFALLLLWMAFVRLLPPRPDAGEAGRVQVEFIGRGTPAEEGGGAASEDAAAAAAARAVAAAQAQAQANARAIAARAQPAAAASGAAQAPASPPPSVPPPPAEQPLQVTETPQPTQDFVLPPPPPMREIAVTPREVAPPQVQVPVRQIDVVTETPTVQIRPREVVVPRPAEPQLQVREREVPAPLPQVAVPQIRPREPSPTLRTPEAQVRQIELPSPSVPAPPAPVPAPAPASADAASGTAATTAAAAQTLPSPAAGTSQATAPAGTAAVPPGSRAAAPGSGPASTVRDGGWATPQRGDDWGASARNRAGGAGTGQRDGLFNGDGSVRVPGGDGSQSSPPRGAPGSERDTWSRDRIAESGKWLKRPPYDYTPTSFDKYWIPNESLLEEWVRRGVKQVTIPIPGTTSSISCTISILQFGGGCSLTDPNLNEQPATARPPPDVPFKPGLQEDNGSR